MIRNVMFGISMLALSGSAFAAAPAAKTHHAKAAVVAEAAPAGDTAAPADKPVKKEKKAKKAKGDATKTEGAKEMKGDKAPAPTPAPETK